MIHLKGPYRANHDHIETSVHCIHTIFNKEIWICEERTISIVQACESQIE